MSNQINHNPVNDPDFPISPVANSIDDTEGHSYRFFLEEAGEGDTAGPTTEDTDDAEGHRRVFVGEAGEGDTMRRAIDGADDTEGHIRLK